MIPVRIRFAKTGDAKFISHLDLNRAMTLALRRAKIPLWYSEGFNPHPRIVFPLPLPVGTESICDIMDIRVRQDFPMSEIPSRLSAQLPEIFRIISAAPPVKKAGDIAFARYEIDFDPVFAKPVEELLSRDEILVGKPLSKKRRRHGGPESETVEIKSEMRDLLLSANPPRISVTLPAGEKNVAPKLIAAAVSEYIKSEFVPARIIRTEIFDAGMEIFK